MDVYEMARELGNKLLESDEAKKLNDKKYIFEGNDESRRRLFEYSRDRENIYVKMNSGQLSEEELAQEQAKLKEKINEVMADPIISDMIRAEEDFAELVNNVMSVLRATVEGDTQGGCSGSCSSCGGCH